jgi:multisubunit Na+/H+ antiporter MnhF subunit
MYGQEVFLTYMIRMFNCCIFRILKGSGRAFCAGGDIVTLYKQIKQGTFLEVALVLVILNFLFGNEPNKVCPPYN